MPSRQRAHLGDALRDLLAEQHAAAAGLGALADHDLDRVGFAKIVRVHAVARRQHLIDESLRDARVLPRVMPPSPVVVEVPMADAPRPSASLAGPESAPKLMPAMVTGISDAIGFLAKRVPSMTSVAHFSR